MSRYETKGNWIVLLSLVLSIACANPGRAPSGEQAPESDQVFAAGHRVVFQSRILEEERELLVYLPESYGTADLRYPVLYLLDAENDFLHTIGIAEFLAGIDRIPELIVVGVVNTNRSRDLTPESGDSEETAFWDAVGGADRFQRALREEAIPFVDRTYRTERFRILRGQSFGGLFAIHDYMSAAPVFDAVLASSPAVGWNHGKLLKAASEFFLGGVPRPLFVASAGKDFPGNLEDIVEFARIVDAANDGKIWRHEHFESDGHYTLHHQSTYRGLQFVFASWPVPDEIAQTADFDAYAQHFADLSRRYGYTIQIPMQTVVRIGNQLLREQDFEKGISVFERAQEIYISLPEAHWRVGEAYRLAGRSAEARPHFERAYELATAQNAPDLSDYKETLDQLDQAGRP
ncbi:MAG: hypothetical protein KJO06_05420 [Gemmatimonadetes bacterium]|nr:hypothetical protein [Gemmatimonadota bacterium]